MTPAILRHFQNGIQTLLEAVHWLSFSLIRPKQPRRGTKAAIQNHVHVHHSSISASQQRLERLLKLMILVITRHRLTHTQEDVLSKNCSLPEQVSSLSQGLMLIFHMRSFWAGLYTQPPTLVTNAQKQTNPMTSNNFTTCRCPLTESTGLFHLDSNSRAGFLQMC